MTDQRGRSSDRWRVGRSLGTTIYHTSHDDQPVGWFPDRPALARRVVDLLNRAEEDARE